MKQLYIEIADTDYKKEKGLMYRKHMPEDEGMLFKNTYASRLSFWMQNTYIPLDIAFIDDDGKILQIEEMIPLSTRAITSNSHCKYALEVNKGWFKENSIKVGDYIDGVCPQTKTAAGPPKLGPMGNPLGTPNQNQAPNPNQPSAQVVPKSKPRIATVKNIKEVFEAAKAQKIDVQILYGNGRTYNLSPYKHYELNYVKGKSKANQYDSNARATIPNANLNAYDNSSGHNKSFRIKDIVSIADKNGKQIQLVSDPKTGLINIMQEQAGINPKDKEIKNNKKVKK